MHSRSTAHQIVTPRRCRLLATLIAAVILVGGCGGHPGQVDVEDSQPVGTVDTGHYAPDARLVEECIDDTPYYILSYKSRFAMAERVDADGTIPACRSQGVNQPPSFKVREIGKLGNTGSRLGEVCINGVTYLYASTLYTAGLAVKRTPQGRIQPCAPRP